MNVISIRRTNIKNVKYILKQMVPYRVEVFVSKGSEVVEQVFVGQRKIGVALVPQNFAEIAIRDVVEDGAPILVNLLALKFQDLKKKSLRLPHPQ